MRNHTGGALPVLISASPHLSVVDFSHRGLVRENNEDRLAVQGFRAPGDPPQEITLAVLCDGVGGHAAGEVAARAGVDAVVHAISSAESISQPGDLLAAALLAANQDVLEQSGTGSGRQGMGATCACALIIGDLLYIANLGDSRIYLVRGRGIHQLTYDHTWLEEAGLSGLPGAEVVTRQHPLAHVLSRYLGSDQPLSVDLRIRFSRQKSPQTERDLPLKPGDRLLLCSDGLTDLVSDQDIFHTIRRCKLEKTAKRLVLQALQNGGHDNVSVIVMEVPVGGASDGRSRM